MSYQPALDPALVNNIRALARRAAREDYAAAKVTDQLVAKTENNPRLK